MKVCTSQHTFCAIVAALLCSTSASYLQLRGIPIDPTSLPDLPHDSTPRVPTSHTDFTTIEAAILTSSNRTGSSSAKAKAIQPATVIDSQTPDGYDFIFGPVNGATGAPGYMGFTLIDEYSTTACAELCNGRGPDPDGGACQFFNIWLTTINGTDITACAFYFIPTDASAATNLGTSEEQISESRGYTRITLIQDGGFEGWNCTACCPGHPFCSTRSYFAWEVIANPDLELDTVTNIFRLDGAHTGFDFATLGFFEMPPNPGVLQPVAQPLATVAGETYVVTFFHRALIVNADGTFSTGFIVLWNGAVVFSVPNPVADDSWRYYQVQVTAIGSDIIGFQDDRQSASGGSALDDVFLFLDN